ncbi:MAG: hypothetical protein HY046_04970 [Acidobacteria bacterium]|nr:hypothetical protein [Acidobacteriota bacterium]
MENIFGTLLALSLKANSVERVPFIWFWPHGAPGCVMMTHDVETQAGRDFCSQLMDLDDSFEIKSSFQIIPEGGYSVPQSFLDEFHERNFEVSVHDLHHDGHLFKEQEPFLLRAMWINQYGREFGARGFRSGALYHNLEWYKALEFSYDMSVPAVGHLEAQQGGCCSVMPFFVGEILELPVTTTQDYSLFHILKQYSIDLWKQQLACILSKHGLASFIVHPDYIQETREQDVYRSLLAHLCNVRAKEKAWIALPGEVDEWWRARSQMRLVKNGGHWVIEGPQQARARIAYAVANGDGVRYEF